MKDETFEMGREVVEYAKKFEGTPSYNDIMLAIEFGYQLALKYEVPVFGGKTETYKNDDYAGLEIGNLKFYYGYEVVDKQEDWCFQVKSAGEVLYTVPRRKIEKSVEGRFDEPIDYLMAGIGLWLKETFKKKKTKDV